MDQFLPLVKLINFVQSSLKNSVTRSVGLLRCLATISSVMWLADAFAAAYPCKECGENVPGYAAGGGSGAGRSGEGELGCVKSVLIVLIEYCLS
jgi:hypothetical protein